VDELWKTVQNFSTGRSAGVFHLDSQAATPETEEKWKTVIQISVTKELTASVHPGHCGKAVHNTVLLKAV